MRNIDGQAAIDIQRWNKKVDLFLATYGSVVQKIVAYGNTKVSTSVDKNLSGSIYYKGRLPVVRRTGTLRRAYTVNRLTPTLFVHFMDSRIAEYAKYVHNGTRYLRPRPFFKDAFESNKAAIMNYWRYQFILEARKIGRA